VVGTQNVGFNFDNLEEIQVATGGHSAEYGQVSGAVVNAITKSGGNEFSGEGNVYYSGSSLVGTNGQAYTERFPSLTPNELDHRYDTQVQAGGPIQQDKIWFFGSYRYYDQDTAVVGFEELSNTNQNYGYGKVTWQLTPKNKVVASWNYDSLEYNNRGAGSTTRPEATFLQDGHTNTPNVEFTSILSPTTYLQFRGAFVRNNFTLYPKNDEPERGNTYGTYNSNCCFDGYERNRNQLNGSLTHYRDDWYGTHDFKFGFEYEASEGTRDFGGGQVYYDIFAGDPATQDWWDPNLNVPALLTEYDQTVQEEVTNRLSIYGQDSWTVANRLTLNLGLRWDLNKAGFPEQTGSDGTQYPADENVLDFGYFSPRLGASFDVTGDGKSALRFQYSRLLEPVITQYVSSVSPTFIGVRQYIICGGPYDPGGICAPGQQLYQIYEAGPGSSTMDPDFYTGYTDEYTVGFEYEVMDNLSLGAAYIDKLSRDLPEDVEVGLTFVPRLVVDPGDTLVDAETGEPIEVIPGGTEYVVYDYDPNTTSQYVVTNPAQARREYRALELTANKRMSDKWQMQASFVISRSAGLVGTDFGGSTSITGLFDNPNNSINGYGNLNYARPYQLKLIGTYQAPWGINLSGFYSFLSGAPYTRTARFTTGINPDTGEREQFVTGPIEINAERRGDRSYDAQHNMDFRVEKEFKLGFGRLDTIMDVFNLFNADTVTSIRTRSRGTIKFGDPTGFRGPREVRLAARYIW
jgi:hypothetical protein